MATALCVLACQSGPPPHPARWAKAWINSLNSRNWSQVGPVLGAVGTYEDPLTPGTLSATGAAFYWARMWTAFPELRFTIQRITGDGREVAVEWTADGVGAAAGPGPSGIFVLRLHGSSGVSVRGYFNAIPFLFFQGKSGSVPQQISPLR